MANVFLNSPILKDEITDELLFKLIISLFRKGSHRHFFAFIQQLMLQSNSKYQLRTEDGKTWSLLEQNESGDFIVLHTLHNMDNKQVEPPLGPEVAHIDRPPRYSYEMLLELKLQQVFLQKLLDEQERLPCEILGFNVVFKEFVTINQQITEKLQDFSYLNYLTYLLTQVASRIKMEMFFKNPEGRKLQQPKASILKKKPMELLNPCGPFERISSEEEKEIRRRMKEESEALSKQENSEFEIILRDFKMIECAFFTKQLNILCERITNHEFDTIINQASKDTFASFVESIKTQCHNVTSSQEIKREHLEILQHVKRKLEELPKYANINSSTQKLMIVEAIEKASC